jgi:NADPH:quinone reductase-like Zn-dependent oxidoreductase
MTMRGLTAAYLMRRIWPLERGDTILLHAAAGGVGLIVSQWAKLLGLHVIGTVSTERRPRSRAQHGCDHVILYTREDVAKRVRELTGGAGVPVVYDSVGKDTFAGSHRLAQRRGLLVCVGTARARSRRSTRRSSRSRARCSSRAGARRLHRGPAEKTRSRASCSGTLRRAHHDRDQPALSPAGRARRRIAISSRARRRARRSSSI